MATTTNFGWETPDDTDLVKDGAAAIRTVANSIDTSFVDLKGGTTNQVLAKNSNTDLDFKWVADATGIPATIIDAKGDLIAGSAADTAARLAVGANGTVLTADSGETTGLKWATPSTTYNLLDSGTLSGSSVTTASLSQSYKELFVIIRGYRPSSDGSNIRMRINGDSTANRYYRGSGWSSPNNGVSFNDDNIQIVGNQDDTVGTGLGMFRIPDYANTTTWKMVTQVFSLTVNQTTTTQLNEYGGYGYYNQTGAVSTLTFYPGSGGTFSAGSYFVYGI